ncbi:hypothetical protein DL96DRAFT_1607930 [Flagelloscypha sp. PMI_526]|nr:hypothetical protein DL96DRAFT_1607930 [Flagelloscypha sp. PMI_526]
MDLNLLLLSSLLGIILRFFLAHFQGLAKTTPVLLGIWEGVALYHNLTSASSSSSHKRLRGKNNVVSYIPTLLSISMDYLIVPDHENGHARAGLVLMWTVLSAVASSALSGRHWYDSNMERYGRGRHGHRLGSSRRRGARPMEVVAPAECEHRPPQIELEEEGPELLVPPPPQRAVRILLPPPPSEPPLPVPEPPLSVLSGLSSPVLSQPRPLENAYGWPALHEPPSPHVGSSYTTMIQPRPYEHHPNNPILIDDTDEDDNDYSNDDNESSAGMGLGVDSEELEDAILDLASASTRSPNLSPELQDQDQLAHETQSGWVQMAPIDEPVYQPSTDDEENATVADRLSTIPEETEFSSSSVYEVQRDSALEVERPIGPTPPRHYSASEGELEYVDDDDLLATPLGLAPGVILHDEYDSEEHEADLLRTPAQRRYSGLWDGENGNANYETEDPFRNPPSPIRIFSPPPS